MIPGGFSMPIYEYICNSCNKRLSFLVMNRDQFAPKCNKCESIDLRRIMSRFRAKDSEESRIDKLADPSKWGALNENDPKSMVKFVKKMGKEMGDELGEDYDHIVEEAEEEAAKMEQEKSGSKSNDDELL
jgi:putative FmdB family regulatory protein